MAVGIAELEKIFLSEDFEAVSLEENQVRDIVEEWRPRVLNRMTCSGSNTTSCADLAGELPECQCCPAPP